MKTPLIIHFSTSQKPLTHLRDAILLTLCWLMWLVVLVAVFNSTEWDVLESAGTAWLGAQHVFFGALMRSFHVSSGYFQLVGTLMAGSALWSVLNLMLAARRPGVQSAPLELATLAQHFHLDCALVRTMQAKKTVIVHHASTGKVTSLVAIPIECGANAEQLLLAA